MSEKDVVYKMDERKFGDLLETVRVMKMSPGFSIERFITADMTSLQKERVLEELKRPFIENSLFYGYYENDYFWGGWYGSG